MKGLSKFMMPWKQKNEFDLLVKYVRVTQLCPPSDVHIKFQINISKHVGKKSRKLSVICDYTDNHKFMIGAGKVGHCDKNYFHCQGALLNSPFQVFWPPEGQKLPNHEENQ